jgi:hypothetical protein
MMTSNPTNPTDPTDPTTYPATDSLMTGVEFNELYKFIHFIKLVDEDGNSDGSPYVAGINVCNEKIRFYVNQSIGNLILPVDLSRYNPQSDSQSDDTTNSSTDHQTARKPLLYVWNVEIPDNAMVFNKSNIFETDQIILSGKRHVFSDPTQHMQLIEADGRLLQFITEEFQTAELCRVAVDQCCEALQYVIHQTLDLYFKYPSVLYEQLFRHIRNPPLNVIMAYVRRYPSLFQYVDQTDEIIMACFERNSDIFQYIVNPSKLIQMKCLNMNPAIFSYIKNPDFDMAKISVSKSGAFCRIKCDQFTEDEYRELCYIAVKRNGYNLKYAMIRQTKDLCLLAVANNGYALKDCMIQDNEICITALKNDASALKYVYPHLRTAEIYRIAVSAGGRALESVPWDQQTAELCSIAVSDCGYAIQSVRPDLLTDALCIQALMQCGQAIACIEDQTEALCIMAINQSWRSIEYIRAESQTIAVCRHAIDQNVEAVKYIVSPSEELLLYCIDRNASSLLYISAEHQTESVCLRAVYHNDEHALYHIVDERHRKVCKDFIEKRCIVEKWRLVC